MVSFKGIYYWRVLGVLTWLALAVGFGLTPVGIVSAIAMAICVFMFVRRALTLCDISPREKRAYIKAKLKGCRKEINWLDSWCWTYRVREVIMEEEMIEWLELLNEVGEEDDA